MQQYLCIDLKSFYASVECMARNLNPLETDLLVADESRTDKTICLAVSPALKAKGVSSRPRLFEARQAIRLYEAAHRTKVDYIVAPPRMAEYLRVSAEIYGVYRQFVSEEDIHVYSIDECFIDLTPYLHRYRAEAKRAGVSDPHRAGEDRDHGHGRDRNQPVPGKSRHGYRGKKNASRRGRRADRRAG